MLRRNLNSDFVGGAFVFPGGGVDDADRDADMESVCHGRTDADASKRLGVPSGGMAHWAAAIRECFEEAGLLLARHRSNGEMVDFTDPAIEERFLSHRKAIDTQQLSLIDMVRQEDLVLDVGNIHYFAHWITPEGPPRRYDTRFFVAAAPQGQVPLHDNRETVASQWVRPQDALDAGKRGEMTIIFPTMRNLERLATFQCAADLIEATRTLDEIVTVRPRMLAGEEGIRLVIPGDSGFESGTEPSKGEPAPFVSPSPS